MSTTDGTEDPRAAFIDGLRQIARFLEQHPDIPLPHIGTSASGEYKDTLWGFVCGDADQAKATMASLARAMGKAHKYIKDDDFRLYRDFAGIRLLYDVDRAKVCERVVVGTDTVTTDVPDPALLAAVPTVTVTQTVERVEWICSPLLAPATVDSAVTT